MTENDKAIEFLTRMGDLLMVRIGLFRSLASASMETA